MYQFHQYDLALTKDQSARVTRIWPAINFNEICCQRFSVWDRFANIIQDNIAAWNDGLVAAQSISQNQIKEYFMEHFSLLRAQKLCNLS